jgi:general stress protein 26
MANDSKDMLDFNQIMKEKVEFLDAHDHMSLATAQNDLATVRIVTYVNDGLNLYFITNQHSKKYIQINANPKVSACIDNVQIMGKAEVLGRPLDEKNKEYADIYRRKLPEIFLKYSSIPVMVLMRVEPSLFETWVRTPSRHYYEHLDINEKKAYVFKELGEQ